MKTIIAAVDASNIAASVVAEAAALALAAEARIILITVVQPPVITSEYAPLLENIAEIPAAGEKAAARRLAGIEERLKRDGIETTSVQLTGAPITHLLEQAKKYAADYIVMGSHGHTAFYDLLVGSTTHGVLLRAQCPVVIVPPKDKNPEKSKKKK